MAYLRILLLTLLSGALLVPAQAQLQVQTQTRALTAPDSEAEPVPEAPGNRIYRMRDEQGRVIFTDTPPEGAQAQEIRPRQPNSMPAPPSRAPREKAPPAPVTAGYSTLDIVSPNHEQTFQNPHEPIPVQVNLTPPLQSGHSLRVLDNGQPLAEPVLTWPERGTHELRAQVLDAGGEVLKESAPVVIYVHRHSVLLGPGARRDEDKDEKRAGLVQWFPWGAGTK
ncbi:hypothetical protein A167_02712 [Alcanivorax sp. S71-1-4]|uniref:DUF4124 domain-containing protein n=1 Tax=Alcanivorax sp. S71-1-4 TaxID=1177159 RepID=UPI0013582205|nr:DUF4124 domain-containing protein [Alcanivorax sp. S71-1-4]KAF0808204.1 hypothetical protein A167_02712 [Alcanivorax sp. S71-1-4]